MYSNLYNQWLVRIIRSFDPMWEKSKPYIRKYVKITYLKRIETQDTLK